MLCAKNATTEITRRLEKREPLFVTARSADGGVCQKCQKGRIIVLSGRDIQAAWCDLCVGQMDLAVFDRAHGTLRVGRRVIRRWVHDARVHLFETIEGVVMVLLQTATQTETMLRLSYAEMRAA